jgi:hypothetical protein
MIPNTQMNASLITLPQLEVRFKIFLYLYDFFWGIYRVFAKFKRLTYGEAG